MTTRKCVICESGWIICGLIKNETDTELSLTDASVVRRWTNGRGIGAISKKEYKDEYILDPIGNVDIKQNKILFTIPCEW